MLETEFRSLAENVIFPEIHNILDKEEYLVMAGTKITVLQGLYQNFEKYFSKIKLKGKSPDRHKLAACICMSILESVPLVYAKNIVQPNKKLRYLNEFLAINVALEFMHPYLIYVEYKNDDLSLKNDALQRFCMKLPEKKICDKTTYGQNLIRDFHSSFNKSCGNRCDIFAYSTIFYHLDRYNRRKLKEFREQEQM